MWSGVFSPVHVAPRTVVNVARLSSLLAEHPQLVLVDFVLRVLTAVFDVGFVGPVTLCRDVPNRSAALRAPLVTAAIVRELRAGFLCGPFCHPPFPRFHCSPLGDADNPDGSACLILDLFSPHGGLIMPPSLFSIPSLMLFR